MRGFCIDCCNKEQISCYWNLNGIAVEKKYECMYSRLDWKFHVGLTTMMLNPNYHRTSEQVGSLQCKLLRSISSANTIKTTVTTVTLMHNTVRWIQGPKFSTVLNIDVWRLNVFVWWPIVRCSSVVFAGDKPHNVIPHLLPLLPVTLLWVWSSMSNKSSPRQHKRNVAKMTQCGTVSDDISKEGVKAVITQLFRRYRSVLKIDFSNL